MKRCTGSVRRQVKLKGRRKKEGKREQRHMHERKRANGVKEDRKGEWWRFSQASVLMEAE